MYGSGTYVNRFHAFRYSRTPFIRTVVILIANYPDRLDPSATLFSYFNCTASFMASIFLQFFSLRCAIPVVL